eukprot:SAG11_NODE_7737_length_1102_cov_2.837488_1_plen_94_part_00
MCDTSVVIFHRNYGVSAGRGWHGSAAYNGGQGAEAGPGQPRFRIFTLRKADATLQELADPTCACAEPGIPGSRVRAKDNFSSDNAIMTPDKTT